MMPRRQFTAGLCGCSALALAACVTSQGAGTNLAPGQGPAAGDESDVWYMSNKAEADLRRSPFLIRDPGLNTYVRGIVDRLAGEYSKDTRVYLVRTPHFNASMAPNGMMQVWSGLLLRARNEAQIAAVIGHEIGHFVHRDSLARIRDVRAKTDFGAFLGLGTAIAGVGYAGEAANLMLIASIFAYNRDQERAADRYGIEAMARAGYAPIEASRVWDQLITEATAGGAKQPDPFFSTHPANEERRDALAQVAATLPAPGGEDATFRARLQAAIGPSRMMLLNDQIRLRQPDRSLALFDGMLADGFRSGEVLYARGEIYRLRAGSGDAESALTAYEAATKAGDAPAECWRGMGLVYRRSGREAEAKAAFRQYLALKPDAEDRAIIQSYLSPSA